MRIASMKSIKGRKAISILLSVVMVLAALPLTALPTAAAISGDLSYEVISETDKTCKITDYTGSATALAIPSELDGYTVTSIGGWAFENCTALASITIPDSVTSIGHGAFDSCTALTSVTLPNSVTSIGEFAFYGCTALTSITIPNSVTSIGGWAFSGCTSLTSVTLPNSVTSIGEFAFYGCTALTSITIPNSVTSIGGWAFSGCTSLTSITIPNSVTNIGGDAFFRCTALTEIKVDTGNPNYTSESGILFNQNKTALICYPAGMQDRSYTIPNSVTSIGYGAFSGCTALTSISIPDSVTSIGDRAFYGCTALTSITIPDSVTSIGGEAFYITAYYNDATHWENDVLYIGNHLIEAKDTLSGAYTVRAGTKTIAGAAFYDCTSLENITIPDSVTSIGIYAFENCTALTSITIPDSVTSIGYGAFYDSGLTTIYGYTGSYAETFASANGYTFVALQKLTDAETGVSVLEGNFGNFAENTVLHVEILSAEENTITYDITLTANDEIVQPTSAVTVKIPVPAGMDGTQCKVYREETNGKMTNMQAIYQNGYMVFTTDHFSKYVVTTESLGVTPGDVNGDNKINAVDARWVLQAASGARTFDATQTAAADVNGDGKINAVDARWILQVASGARTL